MFFLLVLCGIMQMQVQCPVDVACISASRELPVFDFTYSVSPVPVSLSVGPDELGGRFTCPD